MLAVAGLLTGAGLALGAEPAVAIKDPWLALVTPAHPAAGYLTLRNNTDRAISLVGAFSPACGMVMLHQSTAADGRAGMAPVGPVAVPAHGGISFAPGGFHLMCLSPEAAPGQQVAMTLEFANGHEVRVPFPVRGATAP